MMSLEMSSHARCGSMHAKTTLQRAGSCAPAHEPQETAGPEAKHAPDNDAAAALLLG
jgi:hypothetical protein